MKNILLLTDFSSKSDNAHSYAFNLYASVPCTFHLLSIQKVWDYTMDDLMTASPKSDVNTALLGDNRSQVNRLIDAYKATYKNRDFSFEGHVDYDIFTDAISQAVNTYDIELIVCGTDGKTGIIEAIFSSHTLRIIRNVDCPILVVPEGYPFTEPERIQYLLDYDDIFEMCGKEPLIEITRTYKVPIDVVRLTFGFTTNPKDQKEEHKEIQKFFPSNRVAYTTYVDKDPIKAIQKGLMRYPAQLQVLSARKQTFLERLFSNSHLSQIVNNITIPLLILRDCNP